MIVPGARDHFSGKQLFFLKLNRTLLRRSGMWQNDCRFRLFD